MASVPRKVIDCRLFPSDRNCTLAISGTEEEVLEVAVQHAVASHGHQKTPELREQLPRGCLPRPAELPLHMGINQHRPGQGDDNSAMTDAGQCPPRSLKAVTRSRTSVIARGYDAGFSTTSCL